jgi:hypothetical protein
VISAEFYLLIFSEFGCTFVVKILNCRSKISNRLGKGLIFSNNQKDNIVYNVFANTAFMPAALNLLFLGRLQTWANKKYL